jgi:hypothetical protein
LFADDIQFHLPAAEIKRAGISSAEAQRWEAESEGVHGICPRCEVRDAEDAEEGDFDCDARGG